MFGSGSIQLARVLGIRIAASPSWFIVLFLMIYGLSGYFGEVLDETDTTTFLVAVLGALMFFVSLVLHELGHAVVARRAGIGISGIDLWLFGGVAKMTRDTSSPGEEFRVSIAGPLVTLGVVALCFGASALLSRVGDFVDAAAFEEDGTTPALALLGWLAIVNAFLFVFNMIPAFPLDGGRIARALAWKVTGDRNRATKIAGRLGEGFSYVLIGLGLVLAATSDPINGIWLMLLAWFINQGARGAVIASEFSERIEGVTAADLMDAEPVAVPADLPILQAQDEYFLRYRWPWFPVVDAGRHFLGVVREDRIEGALSAGRPALPVRDVLDDGPADDLRVPRETPLEALRGSEPLRRLGGLAVVDDEDRLVGVLTIDQVRRAVAASAAGP